MLAIRTIPKEVEHAFGEEGTRKFVVFLNETFEEQKINVTESVSDSFHRHISEENSKIRLEAAALRSELKIEIAELRTELKTEIAELRTELKTDIAHVENKIAELRADVKSDISDVHKSISDIHKAISAQTRWMVAALLAGAVIYPIAIKLIDKLLP
jgi:F0F1-type ATP synthase membrane subunit b/b'